MYLEISANTGMLLHLPLEEEEEEEDETLCVTVHDTDGGLLIEHFTPQTYTVLCCCVWAPAVRVLLRFSLLINVNLCGDFGSKREEDDKKKTNKKKNMSESALL